MKKLLILFLFLIIYVIPPVIADEGMWIPILLEKYKIADMQKKGFKLTAEDIYSINKASMKDAVAIFGGGCTGEFISDEGLMITNHHCGFDQIQKHSSLDHDYLTDGFWAMNKGEELSNPGLSITILDYMEDVTQKVLAGISPEMDENTRKNQINMVISKLEREAIKNKSQRARVAPFYGGNEYYLFVSTVFSDVRLVGAPPSAIGKFGGDTDNWEWPRHTGDFSLFRIYADKDNNPAAYSPNNVPYKPRKSFPISLKGVNKNDFTMIFGYPGRTQEYLPSYAIKLITEIENPNKINIRQKKIDIILAQSDKNQGVRIQYASKHASLSNAWKKWIGENRGLKRLNAIERKQTLEKDFMNWVNSDVDRQKKYGAILSSYEKIYKQLGPLRLAQAYTTEAGLSLDIVSIVAFVDKKLGAIPIETSASDLAKIITEIKTGADDFYKNYDQSTDKLIFQAMVDLYKANIPLEFKAAFINEINKKFKGNSAKYVDDFYLKSAFVSKTKLYDFLDKYTPKQLKKLKNDPAYKYYSNLLLISSEKISVGIQPLENELLPLHRIYIAAQREWQKDKVFYPDANSTLRVSYGKIDDYFPQDGVFYKHYTTIEGIIQKDNPNIYDYKVPEKLKQLYNAKDYGNYGENGELHVCFTASNHTTGGNSGSPVLNANGELIGVNFDRCWEGTMSDIMYDPDQCRNIALDIRYALFIIDKFAGAGHLIKEMNIVK